MRQTAALPGSRCGPPHMKQSGLESQPDGPSLDVRSSFVSPNAGAAGEMNAVASIREILMMGTERRRCLRSQHMHPTGRVSNHETASICPVALTTAELHVTRVGGKARRRTHRLRMVGDGHVLRDGQRRCEEDPCWPTS